MTKHNRIYTRINISNKESFDSTDKLQVLLSREGREKSSTSNTQNRTYKKELIYFLPIN